MNEKQTVPYHAVTLYIAGDVNIANAECGNFCRKIGFCVTVTPTTYVYSGGQESGVIIQKINYARFPSTIEEDANKIQQLAEILVEKMNQKSYSITHQSKMLGGSSTFFSTMPYQSKEKQ